MVIIQQDKPLPAPIYQPRCPCDIDEITAGTNSLVLITKLCSKQDDLLKIFTDSLKKEQPNDDL